VPPANRIDKVSCYILGSVLLITVLILIVKFPSPSEAQFYVFRTVMAVAVAGIAVLLPGVFELKLNNYIKATGAIAVFVLIYLVNPPDLIVAKSTDINEDIRRADLAYNEGNFSAACTFYENAIKNDKNNWVPYNGLGKIYYKDAKYNLALDNFLKAFDLKEKKDGSIAYAIAITYDAICDIEGFRRYLDIAQTLLPKSTLLDDVIYDQGVVNLLLWIEKGLHPDAAEYSTSLSRFKNYLERGGSPSHWAHYHLACLYAIKSTGTSLNQNEKKQFEDMAVAEIQISISQIKNYHGLKANYQKSLLVRLFSPGGHYFRASGEPVFCTQLRLICNNNHNIKSSIASLTASDSP
jgi:tetratricopeptide (TPR) repeat protein